MANTTVLNKTYATEPNAAKIAAGQLIGGFQDTRGNLGEVTSGQFIVSCTGNVFQPVLLVPGSNAQLDQYIEVDLPADNGVKGTDAVQCPSLGVRMAQAESMNAGYFSGIQLNRFTDYIGRDREQWEINIAYGAYQYTDSNTSSTYILPGGSFRTVATTVRLEVIGINPTVVTATIKNKSTGVVLSTKTLNIATAELQDAGYTGLIGSAATSYGEKTTYNVDAVRSVISDGTAAFTNAIPAIQSVTQTSVTFLPDSTGGTAPVVHDSFLGENHLDSTVNGNFTQVANDVPEETPITVTGLKPDTTYGLVDNAVDSRVAGGAQTAASSGLIVAGQPPRNWTLFQTDAPPLGPPPPLKSWVNSGLIIFGMGDSNTTMAVLNGYVNKLRTYGITGPIVAKLFNWPSSAVGRDWLPASPVFSRAPARTSENGGIGNDATDNIYSFASKELTAAITANPTYTVICNHAMSANDPRPDNNVDVPTFVTGLSAFRDMCVSKAKTFFVYHEQPFFYSDSLVAMDRLLQQRKAGEAIVNNTNTFQGDRRFLADHYAHFPAWNTNPNDGSIDLIHLNLTTGGTAWGEYRATADRYGIFADYSNALPSFPPTNGNQLPTATSDPTYPNSTPVALGTLPGNSFGSVPEDIPQGIKTITPSDTNDLDKQTGFPISAHLGLYIVTGGTLHVKYADGSEITATVGNGFTLYGQFSRVYATGTSATGITLLRK